MRVSWNNSRAVMRSRASTATAVAFPRSDELHQDIDHGGIEGVAEILQITRHPLQPSGSRCLRYWDRPHLPLGTST